MQVIDDIVIMDSEDEAFKPAGSKLTSDTLAQIDEILYADIGKVQKVGKVSSFSKNLLRHVKPSEWQGKPAYNLQKKLEVTF